MVLSELEELRRLLIGKAFLESTPDAPIRDRAGNEGKWLFYSWHVTMTSRGLELAALNLMHRLETFQSRQLACFGFTGLPLLSACVALGKGKYSGLPIREARKNYGSGRQIEGAGNKKIPVVIIDDSFSSGGSLQSAAQALEADGYTVEGLLCLVYFPGRGGAEWAQSLGYRVEYLFDVSRDLDREAQEFASPVPYNPVPWCKHARMTDGLIPAQAAREAVQHFLQCGDAIQPPASLDADHDARGGVFVSVRDVVTEHRYARHGFWHFHADDALLPRDLVQAAAQTARFLQPIPPDLSRVKIGVTLCGPLEKIQPKQLDFLRYGIVARGNPWGLKLGGALPNTQYFTSESEQFQHAFYRNAELSGYEEFELFRHEVYKHMEAGAEWLPYGSPPRSSNLEERTDIGVRLLTRVKDLLQEKNRNPVDGMVIPQRVYAIAITVFHPGKVNCIVSWDGTLDECLAQASQELIRSGVSIHQETPICVSILHSRELVDDPAKIRIGMDSLAVQDRQHKPAFFLSSTPVYYNMSKDDMALQLAQKAGISAGSASWATFQTASWLAYRGNTVPIQSGFPRRSSLAPDLSQVAAQLADYIVRQTPPGGVPSYLYEPVSGRVTASGTDARILFAIHALKHAGQFLARGDFEKTADEAFDAMRQQTRTDAHEQTLLLRGFCARNRRDDCTSLSTTLLQLCHHDGMISASAPGRRMDVDHDFLPGQVLLALSECAILTENQQCLPDLRSSFAWYRRRFRLSHSWGMVGWHMQCWKLIYSVRAEQEFVEFVFELADWALRWQIEQSGYFLNEHETDGPGFFTACVLEGIADALSLARETGDSSRADAYTQSLHRGFAFLDRLIYREEDLFVAADPDKARGGVRESLHKSLVRIDYVAHTLSAVLKALQAGGI